MKYIFPLIVSTTAFAENGAGPAGGIGPWLPMILMFAIIYFLMIRPQQKKAKEAQKFLTELKKGDRVVTASGIIGTIKNLSEKLVTLEVDEGVNMKIIRSQIHESATSLKPAKA